MTLKQTPNSNRAGTTTEITEQGKNPVQECRRYVQAQNVKLRQHDTEKYRETRGCQVLLNNECLVLRLTHSYSWLERAHDISTAAGYWSILGYSLPTECIGYSLPTQCIGYSLLTQSYRLLERAISTK